MNRVKKAWCLGCNSIDIWNLRLELRLNLRQGFTGGEITDETDGHGRGAKSFLLDFSGTHNVGQLLVVQCGKERQLDGRALHLGGNICVH